MRRFKKIDWSLSLAVLPVSILAVIVACVEASGPLGAPNVVEPPTVSSVELTLARSALAPGQTTQATVVAKSADGKVVSGPVNYSSKNPAIATASSSGVVTAISTGIAVIQATVAGHGATASVTVQSFDSPVATVTVAFDSTKLSVGHTAQASAVVKDTAGKPVIGQTITWSSLTPNVASVSSSGFVVAIAAGTASIQAAVSGVKGSASIIVEPPPPLATDANLAFNDFDTTTSLNPFSLPYKYAYDPADLDIINDPTASGRGKVARFHYLRASGPADVNRSLTYVHKVGWGETMYFKGDFYCPIADFKQPMAGMGRKLLYWQQTHDLAAKYGASKSYFFVLGIASPDGIQPAQLGIWNGNSDGTLDYPYVFTPSPNTWYTIEVRLTNQSAPGVADGVVTVWVDGVQKYTNTALAWVPSSWIGAPIPGGNGVPLDPADLFFHHYQIGQQVNAAAPYDEYRYWDRIGFSTQRISN